MGIDLSLMHGVGGRHLYTLLVIYRLFLYYNKRPTPFIENRSLKKELFKGILRQTNDTNIKLILCTQITLE
jgi:hypothetical protein